MMKHLRRATASILLLVLSCAPAIYLYPIDNVTSIPRGIYTGYFFSAGEGERLRAVFLKSPESDLEVVPQSEYIIRKETSLEDAISFMRERGFYKNMDAQEVRFDGKLAGYLLGHSVSFFSKKWIDVNFSVRNGKLYYSAREIIKTD